MGSVSKVKVVGDHYHAGVKLEIGKTLKVPDDLPERAARQGLRSGTLEDASTTSRRSSRGKKSAKE